MNYPEPTVQKQPPEVFYETPATLIKKWLWQRYFLVNFVKFLRKPFFTESLGKVPKKMRTARFLSKVKKVTKKDVNKARVFFWQLCKIFQSISKQNNKTLTCRQYCVFMIWVIQMDILTCIRSFVVRFAGIRPKHEQIHHRQLK